MRFYRIYKLISVKMAYKVRGFSLIFFENIEAATGGVI